LTVLLTSKLGLDLVVGFLWGTLISVVNYGCLQWTIRRNAGRPPQKVVRAVLNAQFGRYFVNIAALAVVYRHMWVLVGAAIGLTVMLKYTIITQFIESRKHQYVPKPIKRVEEKVSREIE
jgi:hypothetical protein